MAKTTTPLKLDAWEQRPEESAKAFEAFRVYRDMGPERSVRKVAQRLDKSRTLIGEWSSRHDWVARAGAWDRDQDRIAQIARRKAVGEMNERQVKISRNVQAKMINALAALDLTGVKAGELARLMELGLKYERLALGADKDEIPIEEKQSTDPVDLRPLKGLSDDDLRALAKLGDPDG